MSENQQLALAIAIAATSFKERLDKGGDPYILHCLRVMNKQITIKRKILAALHDVMEDTEAEVKDLVDFGFNTDIIAPLLLLTHDKEKDTYEDYIKKLASDEDARMVKLADLEDNSQITRLKGLTKKDFDRVEKYHKAYTYLSKI